MDNLTLDQRSALHCAQAMLTPCMTCTSLDVMPTTVVDDNAVYGRVARIDEADALRPASYRLTVPPVGVTKQHLRDTYNEQREGRAHEALDIPAPRGTQVVAAGDGRVVKRFNSVPGGLTVYQFDPSERFAYYYAHLDHYDQNLTEGMMLKRGDAIGTVGTTGNAREDSPHLHFAIFRLGPEKRWWEGSPINRFHCSTDIQVFACLCLRNR